MIEKPKRPKKPDIQERQPPRTLQELINRYDLDNTKIYDFLDELVNQLNADRETIDSDINGKVNKSGDTMTGGLFMQGNPIGFGSGGNIYFKEDGYGDKFRILPDFNGVGSSNKLIIQSTTGGAGEDPQNWADLVYIHADTGQIELAGEIKFNNKSDYTAIRKIRTINGVDYNVNIGVGDNQSGRMEFQDVNNNVLGSLEVRSDGIYNGKSGKRLLENNQANFVHIGDNLSQFSFSIGNLTGGFQTYIIYGGWQNHFMYLLTVHPSQQTVIGYNQIFNNTGEANINSVTISNNVVTVNFSSTIWGGVHIIGEQAQST